MLCLENLEHIQIGINVRLNHIHILFNCLHDNSVTRLSISCQEMNFHSITRYIIGEKDNTLHIFHTDNIIKHDA